MAYINIRNLRKKSRKSQAELAAFLHITQSTYSKYELGKIAISIETYIQLADYYKVSIDYLVGRKELQNR